MKRFIDILLIIFGAVCALAIIGFFIFSIIYAFKIGEYGGAFVFGVLLFGLIFTFLISLKEAL